MITRIFVALLCVLTASTAQAQDKPRYGGELVFVVPSEPPSYDGHREGTFGTVHPLAPSYNTLLRIDPFDRTGTRPAPDLAESWTMSPDGLTFTFRLRQGVKFHDGSVLTSRDVKATYDKIVFPPAGVVSMRKGSYHAIEAIEAPDPQTVRFRLKWPEASFLTANAAQVAAIRGERAHIQFRGFSPADRDALVSALGPKIVVQESPWDCVALV